MPDNTDIVAPRVPITDERTGLMRREWYKFFLNVAMLTGSGSNTTSISDLMVGPPDDGSLADQLAGAVKAIQGTKVAPQFSPDAILAKAVQGLQEAPPLGDVVAKVAELGKAIQALQVAPVAQPSTARLVMTATAVLDFPNTAAGACSDLTVTVPGAVDGDVVDLGVPNGTVPANGGYVGWVSAADTVTIRYFNNDLLLPYNPASGTFRAVVTRF